MVGWRTPYGVRHPWRGPPRQGCATPYGVRHPVRGAGGVRHPSRGAPPLAGLAGCATPYGVRHLFEYPYWCVHVLRPAHRAGRYSPSTLE